MAFVIADRVKETSTTTGTGALTLAGAITGFQAFSAACAVGDTLYYALQAVDAGGVPTGEWECGMGTYSAANTLTRTTVTSSSNAGAAVSLAAGTKQVYISMPAVQIRKIAEAGMTPGGRLTLESGVPVSTADQTAKTTIYYAPYTHNAIPLWNGSEWVSVAFAETSLALGTLTAGKLYDVFGYITAGALVLESLAWTDASTRATAVTLQDGRYCKSGDKTRLLLGTFYTETTTTTEDSQQRRYLANVYNKIARRVFISVTGESTTSATPSEIDNAGATAFPRIGIVASLTDGMSCGGTYAPSSTVANDIARMTMYQNGTSGVAMFTYDAICVPSLSSRVVGYGAATLTPGYHYLSGWISRVVGTGTVSSSTSQFWGAAPG